MARGEVHARAGSARHFLVATDDERLRRRRRRRRPSSTGKPEGTPRAPTRRAARARARGLAMEEPPEMDLAEETSCSS